MNALIIEDEKVAQAALARTLKTEFPDIYIVGMTSSVQESVEFLKNVPGKLDVIFMDVELSDGECFEIFRQVEIEAKVIMTTAYDNYAIKAFEAGSIDYLLKPIDTEALHRAVSRCKVNESKENDFSALLAALKKPGKDYKERFIVRFNDRIVPIKTSDIAYFFSEDKNNYLTTFSGANYIVDSSLDDIAEDLDPNIFFKISRSCIVAMPAIQSITKQLGGRLKISPFPDSAFEMTVSRSRVDEFLEWLEK